MEIPEMMYASMMTQFGEADVLRYELAPTPESSENGVLIRVHATTVNDEDIVHRNEQFPIQKNLPHILGMDVAGEIVALGEGVKDWEIGERVVAAFDGLGRDQDGSYAEYVTIPVEHLHRIPEKLDYRNAASIGLAFITAWIALSYNAKIRKREQVVIHDASSGIGTSALQIAHWKDAKIIAISGADKAKKLRDLGATIVFDESSNDLIGLVETATDGDGASLIVDALGQNSIQQSIDMLAYKGRIVAVGAFSGEIIQVNIMDVIMKNASIIGSYDELKDGDYEKILDMFTDGTFQPVIDSVMPLSKAAEAHRRIEAGQVFGKIILVPDSLF